MKNAFKTTMLAAVLALLGQTATPAAGQSSGDKKYEDFNKLVKDAKVFKGLFTLHQKDENLYVEIKTSQLNKPMICPIAIARGMGMGGYTLNFDEQWVLYFKKVGDKVQVIRRNVHFQAKKGSPVAHAVETTYTDSVLLALKIRSINPKTRAIVINFNDIFMKDFAQLGLGSFDANRSTWHKIKAFKENIEIEVAATYSGRGYGDDSVIDSRGTTVVIHYGLSLLPDSGYQPRFADDRVGYFLSVLKDFSSDSKDDAFLRYVNRWRLERADGQTIKEGEPFKLSPPKKRIVFWIEKSVPDEYRSYVREGILEWNKAFEKIGFRNAIEVRQQEDEDFDPEDINYNTFRWVTNDQGFAMGPSRVNPLTGEILDADIIFDAAMVRYYKQEYRIYKGGDKTRMMEPVSPIQSARLGLNLPQPRFPMPGSPFGWNEPRKALSKSEASARRLWAIRQGLCQCGAHRRNEIALASMALAGAEGKNDLEVPEELIGQAIKETTMHEVGHTLGLRHNFKASTMLKNTELHDQTITRKRGLVGSVMDYNPVNLAPKGVKQGDYFTNTIGPYDYWVIEYAYKPISGGAEGELEALKKIAARCAQPGHDFATDEDLYGSADPLVNLWDLGDDPMKFAMDRMKIAEELFKTLSTRVVKKGEGYQRVRRAFGMLLSQYGNASYLVASHVGGEHMHRDHVGDPNGRDPMVPVSPAKQREALKFLEDHILTDKTFQFDPQLLRKLGADRWLHWGNNQAYFSGVDYPVYERILRIQRVVLNHMYDADVLSRIQNNALKAGKGENPLTIAEVFRSLSSSVWSDLPKEAKDKAQIDSSVIRRNLQRAHLKELSRAVLGSSSAPPDARSLARMHLRELHGRIGLALKQPKLEDTTRAHLMEVRDRIDKVLNASMQVQQP